MRAAAAPRGREHGKKKRKAPAPTTEQSPHTLSMSTRIMVFVNIIVVLRVNKSIKLMIFCDEKVDCNKYNYRAKVHWYSLTIGYFWYGMISSSN